MRTPLPFVLICLIAVLSACQAPYYTHDDEVALGYMRELLKNDLAKDTKLSPEEKEKTSLAMSLIYNDPVAFAKDSAKTEDFRPFGFAGVLDANESKTEPLGITCSNRTATKNIVIGCVPPPPVVFKLMQSYNLTLIHQANFPRSYGCKIDPETTKEINQMEREMQRSKAAELKKEGERSYPAMTADPPNK